MGYESMFKTHIDRKEIKVVFQHQKAAYEGQLTRPELRYVTRTYSGLYDSVAKIRTKEECRAPVFAMTFCYFDELCMGIAYCSYADEKRYSKEIGRRVALKDALKNALKREGRKDREVAAERRIVWMDYFLAQRMKAREAAEAVASETFVNRMKGAGKFTIKNYSPDGWSYIGPGLPTEEPSPMPSDRDAPPTLGSSENR